MKARSSAQASGGPVEAFARHHVKFSPQAVRRASCRKASTELAVFFSKIRTNTLVKLVHHPVKIQIQNPPQALGTASCSLGQGHPNHWPKNRPMFCRPGKTSSQSWEPNEFEVVVVDHQNGGLFRGHLNSPGPLRTFTPTLTAPCFLQDVDVVMLQHRV